MITGLNYFDLQYPNMVITGPDRALPAPLVVHAYSEHFVE